MKNTNEETLSIGALKEGFVLDHIKAGKAMTIYDDLKLGKLDCTVAIIKNASSSKMGKRISLRWPARLIILISTYSAS